MKARGVDAAREDAARHGRDRRGADARPAGEVPACWRARSSARSARSWRTCARGPRAGAAAARRRPDVARVAVGHSSKLPLALRGVWYAPAMARSDDSTNRKRGPAEKPRRDPRRRRQRRPRRGRRRRRLEGAAEAREAAASRARSPRTPRSRRRPRQPRRAAKAPPARAQGGRRAGRRAPKAKAKARTGRGARVRAVRASGRRLRPSRRVRRRPASARKSRSRPRSTSRASCPRLFEEERFLFPESYGAEPHPAAGQGSRVAVRALGRRPAVARARARRSWGSARSRSRG